jgi:prevent-host-death family protein
MLMRMVGLKALKNKLSEYVRLAASGETVVITDRNRIVAEIVPPRRDANAFFERGLREGWLSPPTNPTTEPPPRHPMVPFEELMRELERDREDR